MRKDVLNKFQPFVYAGQMVFTKPPEGKGCVALRIYSSFSDERFTVKIIVYREKKILFGVKFNTETSSYKVFQNKVWSSSSNHRSHIDYFLTLSKY